MNKNKDNCIGCENDFYNGNNPLGITECWHFPSAKLVDRIRVGMWEPPPYFNKSPIKVFHCRTEKGNVLVKPEAICKDGFWK